MREVRTRRNAMSLTIKAAIVIGLSLVFGGCTGPSWETVDSTEGRFRVSMPGKSEDGSHQIFDTTAGSLSFSWKVSRIGQVTDLRSGSYMVAYADLPPNHDPQVLLRELQHSMAEELSGRVEDARQFPQPGGLGTECSVDVDGTNARFRVILSPRVGYFLLTLEPDHWFLPSYTNRFFDSFEILDAAEK
jgi:hypothetical protein